MQDRDIAPRWIVPAALAWGFAEATVFFVVPDVLLGYVALLHPRAVVRATLATLAGALLGGALVFFAPGAFAPIYAHLPGILPAMVDDVARDVASNGAIAMLHGPLSGIPYKLYAAACGAAHVPFASFLLLSIPARLERFVPVVLIFAAIGWILRKRIVAHRVRAIAGYVAVWIGQYAIYAYMLWVRYGGRSA